MTNSQKTKLRRSCATALILSVLSIPATAYADSNNRADPAPAQTSSDKGSWSASTGVSYSTGDYGDVANTKVISAPLSIKYRKGNWRVKVSTSWVHISGPGSLLQTPEGRDSGSGGGDFTSNRSPGGGGPNNSGSGSSNSGSTGSASSGSGGSGSSGSGGSGGSGSSGSGSSGSGSSGSGSSGSGGSGSSGSSSSGSGSTSGTVGSGIGSTTSLTNNRRSGLGDATISLSYDLDMGHDFFVDLTGKVKIPTASTRKGLGTGKVDFTASVDLVKDVGPASFYISGRRKFAGKPTGSTLRSVWGAGGGASVRASKGLTVGADYDWQQSSFAGGQASSEVTGWAYVKVNQKIGVTLYAGTGLNQASANFLGGATVTVKF